MDAELDAEPCLADLNDDLLRKIASRLAESDLASAVALKRCSSRFKDLATPLVANAVSRINTKWRDAADKIGITGAARIRGGLERNEVLTSLNLRYNQIRAEGAAAIAEALRGNEVLTTIDLSRNDIRREGGVAIGNALAVNEVLTSLDLGRNQIGDEGAKAIGKALAINGVLTYLSLFDNSIGPTGATALADALRVNGVLTDLNLTNNNIGGGTGWINASEVEGESKEVGAKVIYQGREMVVSVGVDSDGELELEDPTGVIAIAKALEVNGVLTSLDVGDNRLTEEFALGIVRVERQRNKLTSLGLAFCSIGPTGAAEIADYVSGSGVLKNINLRYNSLGDEGMIRDAVSGREGFKLEM